MTFELPETSVELWTDPAANDVSFRDAFADRWKQLPCLEPPAL